MSSSKENKTTAAILAAAKRLFWHHGIRKVSVEEICREAAVSKMSFYRIYKNKHELAEKLLLDFYMENRKQYRAIMKQQISFSDKIKAVLDLKHRESSDMSKELLKDIFEQDGQHLKYHIEEYREQFAKEFLKDMKAAQRKGWIRKDIKPEFMMFMLNDSYKKMADKNLLAMYKSPHDLTMEITNFFFYGISLKEGKGS